MGVSGNMERGAFRWAGGDNRLNTKCQAGVVNINDAITAHVIHTNVIRGSTAAEVTIQDNVVITCISTVN